MSRGGFQIDDRVTLPSQDGRVYIIEAFQGDEHAALVCCTGGWPIRKVAHVDQLIPIPQPQQAWRAPTLVIHHPDGEGTMSPADKEIEAMVEEVGSRGEIRELEKKLSKAQFDLRARESMITWLTNTGHSATRAVVDAYLAGYAEGGLG